MRVVLALLCLAAAALAQTYGVSPANIVLANGTTLSGANYNVPSLLTAEDRRFLIALNWIRQDPATWKTFITAQSRWDITEPFMVVNNKLQPNLALHYNPNIAAANHWHAYEMANTSPASSLAYIPDDHCKDPTKWPNSPCSPPDLYTDPNTNVKSAVECFRREGCYNPTVTYFSRLAEFDVPIYPYPKSRVAGGNFFAGGTVYTGDVERGVSSAMSIVCDSPYLDQPYNCTPDAFDSTYDTSREILYGAGLGLTIQGAGYYQLAGTKQVNYWDSSFAAAPVPTTSNPIATGGLLRVNGQSYFVINYREPNRDTAAPNRVGVIYQDGTGATQQAELTHASSAALVYTLSASSVVSRCTGTNSIPYCLWATDSTGATYRYPESGFNLDACAGTAVGSIDLIADSTAGVTSGSVTFLGNNPVLPTGVNPSNVPTVPFGKSSAVSVIPALVFVVAALLAMLAL